MSKTQDPASGASAQVRPLCPRCGSPCQDEAERRHLLRQRYYGNGVEQVNWPTEWWCNRCGLFLDYVQQLLEWEKKPEPVVEAKKPRKKKSEVRK